MTTLFIDKGVSINLDDYMADPITHFKTTPPRFAYLSIGERLAIAEFTGHDSNVKKIRDYIQRTFMLDPDSKARINKVYTNTMQDLQHANPNGWSI